MKAGKKTMVIAHRGFSSQYPENTYAAFDGAVDVPVDGIELDIQMTADHVPIIYHDRTLHKVGGGLKRVRSRKFSELSAISVPGSKQPAHQPGLPLFDDVLERYGRKCQLLLEIKRREREEGRFRKIMDRVIEAVNRMGLQQQVFILCYDLSLLLYGHQQDSTLRYVWNQDRPDFRDEANFIYAYSMNIKGLTPAFAQAVHNAGKPLFVFTCDTEKQLDKALACKADGIMSNNPRWLAEALSTESVS